MITGIVERGAAPAVYFIRDSMFYLDNTTGLGILDCRGKTININNPSYRLFDVSYFSFRSNINPNLVDQMSPDTVQLFEFYFRLPHTFSSSLVTRPVDSSV